MGELMASFCYSFTYLVFLYFSCIFIEEIDFKAKGRTYVQIEMINCAISWLFVNGNICRGCDIPYWGEERNAQSHETNNNLKQKAGFCFRFVLVTCNR